MDPVTLMRLGAGDETMFHIPPNFVAGAYTRPLLSST
jgi:hypothetical protein